MLKFAADENFNNKILRGVAFRDPTFDVVRVQDAGLMGADDPTVLSWAAEEGRIVLSHDVNTLVKFADERVQEGLAMPGLILVPEPFALAVIIDDLCLVSNCSTGQEWDGQRRYLPLR